MYHITVRATEKTTSGDDHRALSTETHVTVMVTDKDESGTVTMNRLQPEVGTQIMASLSDPDDIDPTITSSVGSGDDEVNLGWTWYVSKVTKPIANADNHWVLATGAGANTDTYSPHGDCVDDKGDSPPNDQGCPATGQDDTDTAVDEGKYLRVVVRYTDLDTGVTPTTDDVRKAIMVSENPVRAEVSSDLDRVENPENGSPGFEAPQGTTPGPYRRTPARICPWATPSRLLTPTMTR